MTWVQFKGRVFAESYHFKTDWADFVPAMRDKVMRFEVVDGGELGAAAERDVRVRAAGSAGRLVHSAAVQQCAATLFGQL